MRKRGRIWKATEIIAFSSSLGARKRLIPINRSKRSCFCTCCFNLDSFPPCWPSFRFALQSKAGCFCLLQVSNPCFCKWDLFIMCFVSVRSIVCMSVRLLVCFKERMIRGGFLRQGGHLSPWHQQMCLQCSANLSFHCFIKKFQTSVLGETAKNYLVSAFTKCHLRNLSPHHEGQVKLGWIIISVHAYQTHHLLC